MGYGINLALILNLAKKHVYVRYGKITIRCTEIMHVLPFIVKVEPVEYIL